MLYRGTPGDLLQGLRQTPECCHCLCRELSAGVAGPVQRSTPAQQLLHDAALSVVLLGLRHEQALGGGVLEACGVHLRDIQAVHC